MALVLLLLIPSLLTLFTKGVQAVELQMFCKCFCGSNSTIFELPMVDPKPCSNCTKQFCLDNVKDGMCDGIADETCPSNDFRTACFARDSFKDEIIVRIFLVIIFGLIIFAFIKPYVDQWKKDRQSGNQYTPVIDREN
ncbi:hypothetical protein J3Q64DRAFT_1731513 [Phycomyces blakesleeanus]|uniref:Uncharacterized protein n=2 Tax=Phycomyces blakesleeanus TaxID=4837 RepID=A0A162UDY4_PHYB8|nr:hypothetical protein PHYBLDRAFT_186784 [Phycomyces blakesleeanus NRRL 1555(-)]OAD74413.1 hypothetical protein PHYBLDRAFT_186784 [Phycomyces blakesleeanus NRRL 1555(-)]|eukprot:XP_018292453.1 hypothetical protein PHYBLDRAFT_186784 [Phycomyces blakesleeanus NRRL 1555(-)]